MRRGARWAILTAAVGCAAAALPAGEPPRASGGGECAAVERPAAAEEAALRDVARAWREAYNAGDAPRVASLYAEDGQYLSAHVAAHGREAIRAYFQRGIDAGGRIEAIDVLDSGASGTLAWATGTYAANNAGQKVDGRIVLVLRKCASAWLIVAHEVVVRDQP